MILKRIRARKSNPALLWKYDIEGVYLDLKNKKRIEMKRKKKARKDKEKRKQAPKAVPAIQIECLDSPREMGSFEQH